MIILFSFLSVQETYSQFVFLFLCLVPFKWTLFATSIYFPFSIYCFQSFPFIASCRTCPLIFFTLSQSFSLDQNLPVSVFLYYFTPPHLILCYSFVIFLRLHPQYYCFLTCHIISSYMSSTSLYMHHQCICFTPIPYFLIQLLPI